jgi:hypothetical protein
VALLPGALQGEGVQGRDIVGELRAQLLRDVDAKGRARLNPNHDPNPNPSPSPSPNPNPNPKLLRDVDSTGYSYIVI